MKTNTSFGKFADLWDAQVGEDGSRVESLKLQMPVFFNILGDLKGKKVYEIACGNGFLARKLVEAGAKEVVASDISSELIAIAKNKYSDKNITYLTREGTDISGLQKNSFDAVVINQGIFYIEDLDTLFKGIQKILKPGGVLVYNILHPLFPVFRADIGETSPTGEPIDVVALSKKYPTNYVKQVKKDWKMQGKVRIARYAAFKRPISTYINTAGKFGLLVSQTAEPASSTRMKGKLKKSAVPSSFIIKSVKI